MAALNDRGEFSRFIVGNMEKQFVPVCAGNEASRQLCTDWFSKLMDLGAVGLEFDHQVGGYPSVCYSDQHGHPSGYGPWRNLTQAQRTYARNYVVFGQMLRPAELKTPKVKVDVLLPEGKEVPDPPTVDVPVVITSTWRSPEGKTGYLFVNWTGEPQSVEMGLRNNEGPAFLVTATERRQIAGEAVNSGHITLTVPGRGLVLVEQE